MTLQPAAGGRDLNPQQVESNQQLSKILGDVYRHWGYEEVSPPSIERLETLMADGAINASEIVKLVANEPLGLRPEMTVSMARVASTRLSKRARPLRLWSSGTVFQSRVSVENNLCIDEKLQSDVELIGTQEISAEIELLSMLLQAMERLELTKINKPILLISHTKFMDLILKSIDMKDANNIKNHLINYNRLELEQIECGKKLQNYLLNIQKIRGKPLETIKILENLFGNNSIINDLKKIFNIIQPLANEYGIKLQLDPTFQPYFELYTGLVFQFICDNGYSPIVVARGGRYDNLVKRFSNKSQEASGLGFSISIDKIQELKKYRHETKENQTTYLVAYGPNSNISLALNAQNKLHKKGFKAILELNALQTKEQALSILKERNCDLLEWQN